jgi:hypothetical protein
MDIRFAGDMVGTEEFDPNGDATDGRTSPPRPSLQSSSGVSHSPNSATHMRGGRQRFTIFTSRGLACQIQDLIIQARMVSWPMWICCRLAGCSLAKVDPRSCHSGLAQS